SKQHHLSKMFKSDDQNLVNNSSAMPLLESMSSNVVNAESKQDQNHQNHIRIAPKFPPTVDMIELISKKSPDGRIPARAPNAFIIYRKVYVETARENGHYLPMTI
ncbi:426_t:CDS:1, partial [Dentiscutata erythropus]